MNFTPCTVQSAIAYCASVRELLMEVCAPRKALNARIRAVTWGGLNPEELNALARICGHPFAPDLPEWMTRQEVRQ